MIYGTKKLRPADKLTSYYFRGRILFILVVLLIRVLSGTPSMLQPSNLEEDRKCPSKIVLDQKNGLLLY